MSYPNLTRSLLALAIAGASFHVSAATIDISNGPINYEEEETISGPLTVIGSFDGDAATGTGDVFEFQNSTLNGSLIFDATITTKGGIYADPEFGGSQIVMNGEAVSIDDSDIQGSVINKRHLEITGGFHSEVFELDRSTVAGDLINEGKIIAGGRALVEGEVGYNGENPINIFDEHRSGLVVVESDIGGNLINSGQIQSSITGSQMAGGTTDLYGVNIEGSTIKGSLNNSGAILVDGDSAGNSSTGILIAGVDAYTDDWDGQSYPQRDAVIGGQIKNTGTIKATGNTDAVGIRFGNGFTVKGGLHNTGTIHGDSVGIKMEGTGTTLNITQAGGVISGGDYAIDQGNNTANLTLAGGKIDGNLNVNNIDVTGSGKITADEVTVTSGALSVNSGKQLNLGGNGGALKLNVADFAVNGGTLGLLGDVTNGNPLLDVSGVLTFEAGSTVSLSGVKGFTLEGKEYLLITADGITDNTGDTLFNGNMLVEVTEYSITDEGGREGLTATVALVEGDKLADLAAAAGASSNAQAAAREVSGLLDSLTTSGNASFAEFAAAFDGMSDAEVVQAIEQMTPDVDGGAAVVATQGLALMSGVTSSRTSGIRGQSSGAALTEAGVWAQGLYSDARQGTRNGVAGYNAYTSGMAIGADAKVTDSLTVGVAYGYMDSTVNSKRGNTTEVDGHSFTIYGGYELDNYFVDSSLTYSKNENKSKRQVLNSTAKGTYDSNTLGLSVLGGYDFKLDGMTVSPLVGMNYSNTKLDGYTEKGSAAALRNGSQRYEIAELGAGARLSASYPLGQGRLEPQVQAMVYHDFAADSAKSTSTFVNAVGGSSFVAYGAKPQRTSYQANVGADYKIGAFTVGGSYGYTGKKGFDSDTFAAKVRYDF